MLSARTQVLLSALCFGTTGTAQALGPDATDPVGVGAARILVGGALLVAVAAAAGARSSSDRRLRGVGAGSPSGRRARGATGAASSPGRWARGPGAGVRSTTRRWARAPVAIAVAGVAVYQLAFFAAVAETGVAVGTIVALGSAPTIAGLFEWVLGRRPAGRWAAATALACAGVAALALAGGDASVSAVGVALAVTAGGAYAAYTLAAKRLLVDGHAPESVMAVAFGLGATVLLPALFASGAGWLARPDGIALALFLGIVPTALAYVLFARGLRGLSASETATLTLAEPLTAAVLGVVVLAEQLTAVSAAGAALVLAGLLALALRLPAPPVAVTDRVAG